MSELNNNILGDNIETKAIDNDVILGATTCGTYDLADYDKYYIHVLKLSIISETVRSKNYNIKSVLESNETNNKIYANNNTTQTLYNVGNYFYYYLKDTTGSPLVKGMNTSILGPNPPSPTNITLNIPGHYANSFTQNWYTVTGSTEASVISGLNKVLNGVTSISISNVTANINRYTLTNGKTLGAVSPLLIYISVPPNYDEEGEFYYYSYTTNGTTYYPAQQIKLKYSYDKIGFQIYTMFGSSCKINNSQAIYINLSGFSNNSSINLDNYVTGITYDDKIQTVNIFNGRFPYEISKIVKNTDKNCCLASNISINNNFFGFYTTVTNQNQLLKAINLKGINGTGNVEKLGIEYNQERDIIITPNVSYIEPTNEPPLLLIIYNLSPKYNLYVFTEGGTQLCKVNKSTSSTMSSASINVNSTNGYIHFLYSENSSINTTTYKYKSYSSVVIVDNNTITYDSNKGYYDDSTIKECLMYPQYDILSYYGRWSFYLQDLYDGYNGVLYCHNYTNNMYADIDFELSEDFSDYPLEISLYYQSNFVETITLTQSGDYEYLYMDENDNFYDYEVYFSQDVQLLDCDGEILTDSEYIYSGYHYVSNIRPVNYWDGNSTIYIKKV